MTEGPDVIVLGAGISGLVSAALLATRGLRVCVLEKGASAGGYVTGFHRRGFYFDATGAFVSACEPGGELSRILDALGIERELSFLPIKTVWNIYPDFSLRLNYQNPAAYLEALKRELPGHERTLDAYRALTERLGREFMGFERAPTVRKALLPLFFPTLLRYARRSHADVLNRFFKDDKRPALALSALPTTLPPSRLSYVFVAVLWAKVLHGGVFYPRGGMKSLTDALVRVIRENGSTVETGVEVEEILVRGRRALGVRTSDGTWIQAPWIIGAFNPFQGERLLPEGTRLYGRLHRLERYRASLSAVLFYVGLPPGSLPDDWPYFISIHTSGNPESMAAALERGSMEEGLHLVATTPTVLDPSLAPPGHHGIKVLVHAPRADLFGKRYGSESSLQRLRHRVFSALRRFTGLDVEARALFVERATPMILARMTGNEQGAMYGLDAACDQVGPRRPPNRTRLDNLLWVGHYTHPAHGIVGSAMSGRFAAETILSAGSIPKHRCFPNL